MIYPVERHTGYDFFNQSYASKYPNLHKYPATMLPQIGIKVFNDLNIGSGLLLDPYCGSGSTFAAGLECGINEMYGYDLNPLAVLISKVKFTKVSIDELFTAKKKLREDIFEFIKDEHNINSLELPKITNIDFWYSKEVKSNLNVLRYFIQRVKNQDIRNFFLVPFSETVRECSFTRNNEFKLFRMKPEEILNFNPDVFGVYFKKLNEVFFIYSNVYFPKLKENTIVDVKQLGFKAEEKKYDVVLTSPPYGDSSTTVAYGQFSTLSNEWGGFSYARKIDKMLMGGKKANRLYQKGLIADYISDICKTDNKKAIDVSSFYFDLESSIIDVAKSINEKGKVIYVVGNRTVKNVLLPTDQFIAEKFEENEINHIITYERALSSKAMPSMNSPTNIKEKNSRQCSVNI